MNAMNAIDRLEKEIKDFKEQKSAGVPGYDYTIIPLEDAPLWLELARAVELDQPSDCDCLICTALRRLQEDTA